MFSIRAIAICPDDLLMADLRVAAEESGGSLELIRRHPYYPNADDVVRLVRTHAPHLILIEATEPDQVRQIAATVERIAPGTPMVAVSRERTTDKLLPCMQAGLLDFMVHPFDKGQVSATLRRVSERIRECPPEVWQSQSVIGFVSAKPGSGATTLAAHTAIEMARQAECRSVVFDLDSRSSVLDFMLHLRKRYGLLEAAPFASEIDSTIWAQLTARVNEVDFVGMGEGGAGCRLSQDSLAAFVHYARRHYDLVCLDLPSRLDDESLPLLHQCSTIFLVCTPEVGSLHLARRRLAQFEAEGLLKRVRVIVNRLDSHSERATALPELLRYDVFATTANSYAPLQRAAENGCLVDRNTAFGKGIERLAARCLGRPVNKDGGWRWPDIFRSLFSGSKKKEVPAGLLLPPPSSPSSTDVIHLSAAGVRALLASEV